MFAYNVFLKRRNNVSIGQKWCVFTVSLKKCSVLAILQVAASGIKGTLRTGASGALPQKLRDNVFCVALLTIDVVFIPPWIYDRLYCMFIILLILKKHDNFACHQCRQIRQHCRLTFWKYDTVVTGEIHINNKVILSDSIAVSLFGNMTQLLQEKYT